MADDGVVASSSPVREEDDLDRPVTRREFNAFVGEMRTWIELERKKQEAERTEREAEKKEREAEKKEREAEKKDREAERAEKAAEKAKINARENADKEERDLMQQKWKEGKLLEYTLLFFRIHQGGADACFYQHSLQFVVGGHAKTE